MFATLRLLVMRKTHTNKTCLLVVSYLLDDKDEISNVSQLVACTKISMSITRRAEAGSDAHVPSTLKYLFLRWTPSRLETD